MNQEIRCPCKLILRKKQQFFRENLKNLKGCAAMIASSIEWMSGISLTPQTIRNVVHYEVVKGQQPRINYWLVRWIKRNAWNLPINIRTNELNFGKKWYSLMKVNLNYLHQEISSLFRDTKVQLWTLNTYFIQWSLAVAVSRSGALWHTVVSEILSVIEGTVTARLYVELLDHNLKDSAHN